MRQSERSKNPRMFLLVSALAVVLAGCGGSGGTPGPTDGAGTTAGGSSQPTTGGTSSPGTTQAPPSGTDEGSIFIEFLGTRHEFSVAKDIEIVPGSYEPTRCEPNAHGGMFWVGAVAVDEQGQRVDFYSASFGLFPDGTADFGQQPGVTLPGDGTGGSSVLYRLDRDDPGTWIISGNRASGELNLTYFDSQGTEQKTMATFEFICPG